MYDVIVIGAGVSGCTAAKILAENGYSVLLVERCKLPRYKSCSGMLIKNSVDLISKYYNAKVPQSVMCTPFDNRGMVFTNDEGREYKFDNCGINIWRDKFDYWLATLAKEKGVVIQDESVVTSVCETDNIVCATVNGKAEYAKFAVDCSGVVGIGKQTHNNVITYQTYNKGVINLDSHYFYAYLQPELSGYDAWFNVKDDMLVLGVASTQTKDIQNFYQKFIAYMSMRHGLSIDKQLSVDKWLVRYITPPFNIDYGAGGILKAGENANFLNPMGEGISSALESGYRAARAIISNFNHRENVIEDYKRGVSETKNYMQRQWQLVGRISKKFAFMYQNNSV